METSEAQKEQKSPEESVIVAAEPVAATAAATEAELATTTATAATTTATAEAPAPTSETTTKAFVILKKDQWHYGASCEAKVTPQCTSTFSWISWGRHHCRYWYWY